MPRPTCARKSREPKERYRLLDPEALRSVVFGCSPETFDECMQQQLFGLPKNHFQFVQHVKPGMPLFLLDCNNRQLHGVFEATSAGKLNINEHAWSHVRLGKTRFPAQVQVRVRQHCDPLPEYVFKPVIADNYYDGNRFCFELDSTQTNSLIALFQGKPAGIAGLPQEMNGLPQGKSRMQEQQQQQYQRQEAVWRRPQATLKTALDAWNRAEPFLPLQSPSCMQAPEYLDQMDEATYNSPVSGASDFDDGYTSGAGCEQMHFHKNAVYQENSGMLPPAENRKADFESKFLGSLEQSKVLHQQNCIQVTGAVSPFQSTGKVGFGSSSSTLPECERLAREKCLQEQNMLREERDRLKESLQSVDSSVANAIHRSLELCATALAQVGKLQERNAMLEHTQVELHSEIKILKLDRDRMSKQLETLLQASVLMGRAYVLGDGIGGISYDTGNRSSTGKAYYCHKGFH